MQTFNSVTFPDSSGVAYYAVAGDRSSEGCLLNQAFPHYDEPSDGCIAVSSALYLANGAHGGFELGLPPFDLSHAGLPESPNIFANVAAIFDSGVKTGSSWGASVQVSDTSAKPSTLTLVVKADGGSITAWTDTRASQAAAWGAQCEAGAAGVTRCATATKLSDQSGAASNPVIAANATSVYLTWRDDTAGGGDIRSSRRTPS